MREKGAFLALEIFRMRSKIRISRDSIHRMFHQRVMRKDILWNMRPGHSRPHWVRSRVVGASCFLYLFPSVSYFVLALRLDCIISAPFAFFLGITFAAVSIISFLADFIHIPTMSKDQLEEWLSNPSAVQLYSSSRWGMRDRVVSLSAALLAILEASFRVGVVPSAVATLISFLSMRLSRMSSSPSSWVVRHTLWYVTSSTALSLLALLCRSYRAFACLRF